MKKNKIREAFLSELRKVPIIQVACEKVNISRNSVYRWKNSDKKFREEMETALTEGEALINDLTEHQLLTLIKEKDFRSISFWLRHRNSKFRDKVEVTAKLENEEPLSREDKTLLKKALSLAMPVTKHEQDKK